MKKYYYKKEKWLRKQYCEKGLSAIEIARKCRVQKSTIYYWLKKFGMAIKTSSEARKGKKRRKRKKTLIPYFRLRFWLYDMYVTNDMTMAEIAEICNCSEAAIRTWLINFEIEIRPQKRRGQTEGMSDAWYYRKARESFKEYWRETPPDGYIIHHFDRNITNWDVTNLPLVTRSFHNTIHHKGKKRGNQEALQVKTPQQEPLLYHDQTSEEIRQVLAR